MGRWTSRHRPRSGPEAFYATALWLRDAYADLRWDVDTVVATVVAEGDLVAAHATMSGRQIAPFVSYGENAEPVQVFPPTGKTFATTRRTGSGSPTGR